MKKYPAASNFVSRSDSESPAAVLSLLVGGDSLFLSLSFSEKVKTTDVLEQFDQNPHKMTSVHLLALNKAL